jgi:methylmalonyl-CoA/ethylmalonyl-CoA epimerase
LIRRLDHVAVVVTDTDAALTYFRDRLGLDVAAVDEPPEVPVRLTYLDLGNTSLQLVEPLDPEHTLAVWLREHGEGLHHICFGVDDVQCELQRIGPRDLPVPPLGSGRGRPAGFPAGDPQHGVRIECTSFLESEDVADAPGWLKIPRGDQAERRVSRPRRAANDRR